MSTDARTEIILVEIKVYEKDLQELASEYERIHANYISSLREKNSTETKRLLLQLDNLNQEIQLLAEEIAQRIKKINTDNDFGDYKDTIVKKKSDLNTLVNKLTVDETKIKRLLHDTIDLDGKNETLRIQQKTSTYYLFLYALLSILLIYLSLRMFTITEIGLIENIVLIIAVLAIIYLGWVLISGWWAAAVTAAKNNLEYDSSSVLYRMLN